jgi:hypothetical protein
MQIKKSPSTTPQAKKTYSEHRIPYMMLTLLQWMSKVHHRLEATKHNPS